MNDDLIRRIEEIERQCYTDRREEALQNIQLFLDDLVILKIDNNEYLTVLNLMLSSLERKDFVLFADYLEYGIKATLLNYSIPNCILDDEIGLIPSIDEKYFYIPTCTDELSLCVKKEDKNIIRLNSSVSPMHEAEVIISNLKIKKTTPAVCLFGIGTGILAEKILEALPDNAVFIIYEPDNGIKEYCLGCIDAYDYVESEKKIVDRIKRITEDKRVIFYVAKENENEFECLLTTLIDYRALAGLIIAIGSGYSRLYTGECLKFIRTIEDFRRNTTTNKNTFLRFQSQYIENIFKNMWTCKKMNLASQIGDILPKEIPAVIVAAGPSLEKNINLLNEVKGHFLIVAVDTAVKYLMQKDIVPDITVTVDPIKSSDYYKDERTHDIPCVFEINANTEIINKQRGRCFILACNDYINGLLESVGKNIIINQSGGGSVATVAFALLHDLHQKKIILIGQDLASSNGKTHAGDIEEGILGEMMVEGINGKMVTTRGDWYNYLKWYEDAIKKIQKEGDDITVIDATEGGAKIHGTEIMTLREAIDGCRDANGHLPEYDFKKELGKLDYYLSNEEYLQLCINHRKNVMKLKELKAKAEEVVHICKKLTDGIKNGTVSDSYINKEKKKISKIHDAYMHNAMHPIINDYLCGIVIDAVTHLSLAEGDKIETELNGIKLLQVSFENIAEVTQRLYDNAKEYEDMLVG